MPSSKHGKSSSREDSKPRSMGTPSSDQLSAWLSSQGDSAPASERLAGPSASSSSGAGHERLSDTFQQISSLYTSSTDTSTPAGSSQPGNDGFVGYDHGTGGPHTKPFDDRPYGFSVAPQREHRDSPKKKSKSKK